MRLSLKPVVGALVLVGIYAAAGYIGVPAGVRWAVGNVLPEALNGRTTTVGEISFNPWNWTLTLENLSIDSAERPGSHMLELDRAVLDASISSLTRMAPVLDAVTIDGLRVQLTASELNNAEAEQAVEAELAQAPSEGSSGAAGLPAFSLSNVAVRNSSMRLVNTADNAEVEVSEINFSLPLISTLPDAGASSMTPALSLKINGRPLKAEGSIEGENATLALAIDQLNLAQILKAAPVTLDYDVKSAELSGNLALAFTLPKSGAPAVSASGTLTLANLEAATESGAPLAKMKSATLDVAGFDLAKQTIAVKSLAVQGPELYLNLEPQASRQKQTAGAAPAAPALAASGTQAAENKAASAEAAGGWHWSLESATIADGVVALTDKTMSPAAKVNVSGIKVAARNFSSDSGNQGEYSIAVNINGAAASSAGTLAIAPLSVKASAETKGLSLSALSPWVKHFTGYSISQGTLTTAGNFEFKDGPTPDVIWKGKANLANFSALDPKGAPLASVKDASVDVALFDLAKKTVAVNSVNVASPAVQVAFESQSSAKAAAGTAAKGTDKAANKTADATTGKAASTEAPWSWSVKSAAVTNGALTLKDASLTPAATLSVTGIALNAANFSSAKGASGTYKASAKINGGRIDSEGKLALAPLAVDATTNASALGLAGFTPWIRAVSGASFTKGSADVIGRLAVKETDKLSLSWQGDLAVDDFEAKSAEGKTLMTWKQVTGNGIKLDSVEPLSVSVAELTVKEPAQKAVQATSKLLELFGAIAEATGHANTARRLGKAEDAVTQDITLKNLNYKDGRFRLGVKGRDPLESLVLDALNKAFTKTNGKY